MLQERLTVSEGSIEELEKQQKGFFTAPVRGVYYFRFTGHVAHYESVMILRLVKYEHVLVTAADRYTTPTDAEDNASNGLVVQLEVGDVVSVQIFGSVWDDHYHRTTFSGFLLFPFEKVLDLKPSGTLRTCFHVILVSVTADSAVFGLLVLSPDTCTTVTQVTLCTGGCNGMGHPCRNDGVDCPLSKRRAVPAPVFELKLTLVDAHLGSLSDDDNGIGATLADNPLSGGQTGDLVTDYART
ncbi:hypothetical protein FQN60_001814 [Etheostoma spectabile]|uniref:C1q domain-containing protein n=1 Tax=Etheostoma spectabile TaxID=54343 RepID=A0A5J5DDR4_9PERO|nr:hypothetical protein FQN60_001814 [Etheostoma spectabile]